MKAKISRAETPRREILKAGMKYMAAMAINIAAASAIEMAKLAASRLAGESSAKMHHQ